MQHLHFPDSFRPDRAPFVPIQVAPEEQVEDEGEIRDMVRRAVAVSWHEELFSYNELSNRLAINGVVLPDRTAARNTWITNQLHDVLEDLQNTAREHAQPIPTLISFERNKVHYAGIITPRTSDFLAEAPDINNEEGTQSTTTDVQIAIEETAPIEKLSSAALAHFVLSLFAARQDSPAKLQHDEIVQALETAHRHADTSLAAKALREMISVGYLTSYVTGQKRTAKKWYVMDPETKQDIIEEIENDTLRDGLEYTFTNIHPKS